MKLCIVGASGQLGRYMVRHALDRGHEVVGVCRAKSVGKLDAFKGRITLVPGATNDREVIRLILCRPRRPGGSLPARLRQRPALGRRARQRPRRRPQRGPAGLEPARGRPPPGEQPHPAGRLRALHGRGADERRADPRSARHRRLSHEVGAGCGGALRRASIGVPRAHGGLSVDVGCSPWRPPHGAAGVMPIYSHLVTLP